MTPAFPNEVNSSEKRRCPNNKGAYDSNQSKPKDITSNTNGLTNSDNGRNQHDL